MAAPPSSPSTGNGTNRRRLPRYNIAFDLAFAAVTSVDARPDPQQLERTVTVNVSLGGLCLYSDAQYPIGTSLYCMLSLPNRPQPIEITGTVAWFQKIDQEAHGYKLGLEFEKIPAADQAILQDLFDHPPAAAPSRSKRILLVDDDQELRQALTLRFESQGFQVIAASDGLEGLRKSREEYPNVIILDLMLPNLNGYEVCRLLKYDQKFHHIPIILCSARCRREDVDMGHAVGADAYVTKPFNGTELIAKVEELLATRT